MPLFTLPELTAPVRAPLRGGILDAASEVFETDQIGMLGYGFADTFWNCDLGFVVMGGRNCELDFGTKAPTMAPMTPGASPFSAYGLGQCSSVGIGWDTVDEKIRDAYLMRESQVVEQYLLDYFAANAEVAFPGRTHSSIIQAVGALEQFAGLHYGAVATLHVPTYFAAQLCAGNVIHKEGDTWYTCYGNKVSIGPGYGELNGAHPGPDDTVPGVGNTWVYVSGDVRIARGDLRVAKTIDTAKNIVSVLAERSYVLYVDCFTAGVSVPQDAAAAALPGAA